MKQKFVIKWSILVTLLCLLFFTPCPASSTDSTIWTFVVFGDTRDETKDTQTGISPYLSIIAQGIASEKPDLVIHTGDLINGYYTNKSSPVHGKHVDMFNNWKEAMRPVYDYTKGKGIPIYVVRGNHEDGEIFTNSHLKKAYLDAFGHLMPQNGPEDEKGLSYSFSHRQAKFIATDQYKGFIALTKGKVSQAWLDEQLANNPKPFTFVFGHTPAYKVSSGKISVSPPPLLYNHESSRDIFWESLKKARVAIYLTGHVHFYSRTTKDGVMQIVAGNGGANMVDFDPAQADPVLTLNYPTTRVKKEDMKAGYLLVTIDEKTSKLNAVQKLWNAGTKEWETGDKFTINKP